MRFSLRKVILSCVLVTLIVILDILHRELRREVQHSDALHLQRKILKRDASSDLTENRILQNNNVHDMHGSDNKSVNKTGENKPEQHEDRVDELNDKRNSSLDDIFISVKTTKKFHESRLLLQLETWFNLARQQTYFFTDDDDAEFQKRTDGHLINTNCSSTHHRAALCCKMSMEYDRYIESNKRWFCHVDDDTYVNVMALERLIQKYDHKEDWYLGKPSISHPLEINNPDKAGSRIAFWFATGGAGFCLSQGLALKMMPYVGGGRLQTMCSKIRLPDDCTVGYIISHLLKVDLTKITTFHSHLEGLWQLTQKKLADHISFSYGKLDKPKPNVVRIEGYYNNTVDKTRFRSIHCVLYPHLKECKNR